MTGALFSWPRIDESCSLLADVTAQATILLVLALVAGRLVRRRPAAVRHAVWAAVFFSLVTLPILNNILPHWPVLPGSALDRLVAQWRRDPIASDTKGGAIAPRVDSTKTIPIDRNHRFGVDLPYGRSKDHPASNGLAERAEENPPMWHDGQSPTLEARWQRSSELSLILLLAWLVGLALFVARLAASALYLCRVGRPANRSTDCPVAAQLEWAKNQLGWSGRLRLLIGRPGSMPMAWGTVWPSVLLPEESRNWSPTKLRAVLLHELAHLVRGDVIAQYVVEAARAFYWFHPLVWWAARLAAADREEACDDLVLNRGFTPGEYARQLLDVVRGARLNRIGLTAGIAMASSDRLERRLRSILDETANRGSIKRPALMLVFAVGLLIELPLAMTQFAPAGKSPPPKEAKNAGISSKSAVTVWNDAVANGATRGQTDASLERRVRELIYILRYHRLNTRVDEWASAIRELIQIGKPAVPELVAELDRTKRNETLRALAYVLRGIGDRRAVPALIRALRNPSIEEGSDCRLAVTDRELMAFMRAHDDYPGKHSSVFHYGRPIDEISTALEKLTGQNQPGGNRRPRIWLGWWDAHKGQYAAETPREVQGDVNRDLVQEAGLVRFGPFFPTGKDVILGPVHEVTLQFDAYKDARAYVDFDTGRLYQEREGIRPADKSSDFGRSRQSWLRDKGIDAWCDWRVTGHDLVLWLIEDERWETFESEIHSGRRLAVGREATGCLVPFGLASFDFQYDRVGTFLFITREGGRGVAQVFPRQADGSYSHRVRYRMWGEKQNTVPPPSTRNTRRSDTDFGPEQIVVLKGPGRGRSFLFNLEAGRTMTPPDSLVSLNPRIGQAFTRSPELVAWCREHGADLGAVKTEPSRLFDPEPGPPGGPSTFGLVGLDMTALCVQPSAYDEMSLADLKDLVARWPLQTYPAYMISLSDPRRDTYAVVTKSGAMGLLQIRRTSEEDDSLVFRYRLTRGSSRK